MLLWRRLDFTFSQGQPEHNMHGHAPDFSQIADNAFDGILVNQNGQHVYANQRMAEILGYEKDELLGTTIKDVVHPEAYPVIAARFIARLQGTVVPNQYETVFISKTGDAIPVELSATLTTWQRQQAGMAIVRDITNRKKIELALRDSEQNLKNILDNMIDTFYRIGHDGIIQTVSPSIVDLLGYQPDELIGQALTSYYVNPDERSLFFTTLQESNGLVKGYTTALRHKLGHSVWVSTNARAIYDDENNIVSIEGFTRDITAQRQHAAALQQAHDKLELRVTERTEQLSQKITELEQLQHHLQTSEQNFRTLFESAADTIIVHDLQGMILDVNQQACSSLGYSRDELLQKNISNIDIGTSPVPLTTIAQELNLGQTVQIEGLHQHKDGHTFPVEVNVGFLNRGNERMILALVRDITKRKEAELQLISAKEQAEQANRTKTDFLSRMTHELRTPLNAILGFSELLESDKSQPLTESQLDNVHEIINAGQHLLDMINRLLDLSIIESGKLRLHMGQVNLCTVTRECIALVKPMAEMHQVTIEETSCPCEANYVYADQTRLKQIILNLLSNAIKYNHEQGRVTISCSQNNLSSLRLTISDSGNGLTPGQQIKLFQPFERIDAEQTGIEGTGIGLAICKHLVEHMDGHIGVESTPGLGSRFWIELQCQQEKAESEILV